MSDYIKRDDALNIDFKIIVRAFENRKTTATNAVQAYADAIAKIPSEDVRPVVRCRDCKHFQQFRPHNGFCKIDGMLWNNDFFCANGITREES